MISLDHLLAPSCIEEIILDKFEVPTETNFFGFSGGRAEGALLEADPVPDAFPCVGCPNAGGLETG